ncbi:hypothetical protein ACR6EC_22655 [Bacillus subtilis]|jgi:hypothetical protein|uniref:hypothetical protein n=1 Tax=Bacillus TaxID=1386 RepID=UPI001E5A3B92|nr:MULTISPECIES: hypothetical protein [Bacillus]MEC1275267.1 hypothetical protein [Bacillus subtilis]MEC1318366.1 hypothetical protein [Bacillus subtilis]UEG59552.1 hypothetical protein LK685_21785 [Bacillus sp. BC1-43]WGD66077.1 hypothetical protein P5652_22585 [Bacillus subtilis]WGD72703.1 hypothetical protein P5668_00055 [Bacillus subtilis]
MKQIQYHDWGQCYFYLVSLLKERGEAIPTDLKDWSTKAIVKEIQKHDFVLQGRRS